MNSDASFAPRFLGLSPALAAILVIMLATAYRLFYCTWLPILPDESYYLQWSRHLDASYISKGPAVAYTIAAGTALFGANNFGIRFFAVLLSAGTAWQTFILARRWYDETTALIAVLVTGVIPLYAVGAVLMTIDPLSAFFWVWAANCFSGAVQDERWHEWLLAGFAVGCGFLAKYLNALELVAFLLFLLLLPARRTLLLKSGFWSMLGTVFLCTTPVLWWNQQHGWASAKQLGNRGHLGGSFDLHLSTFLQFLIEQSVVISPLIFIALLVAAGAVVVGLWITPSTPKKEGDLLLLLLFLSVFIFYAALSWHLRGEPNWPAVSYLSLIILLAARWRHVVALPGPHLFIIAAFGLGWVETVLLHDPEAPIAVAIRYAHLSPKADPMGRTAGWLDVAERLNSLRASQHADVLIADGYKEASVFSYYLPDQAFVYALRHTPPANQFDLWPGYPTAAPHRALWVTYETSTVSLQNEFNTITPLEHISVIFHGRPYREYTIYLCENK